MLLAGCHRAVGPSAPVARIPRDAARFEIAALTDSTASFLVNEAQWIRSGQAAYIVDPLQRDALVARLRIATRDDMRANALVLSQVAVVKPTHVLLVPRPPLPFWRRGLFWSGVSAGVVLGAAGHAGSQR
jgi:hypothetical protein